MGDPPLAQKSTRYSFRVNEHLPEENVLLFALRDGISYQEGCLSFACVILERISLQWETHLWLKNLLGKI